MLPLEYVETDKTCKSRIDIALIDAPDGPSSSFRFALRMSDVGPPPTRQVPQVLLVRLGESLIRGGLLRQDPSWVGDEVNHRRTRHRAGDVDHRSLTPQP